MRCRSLIRLVTIGALFALTSSCGVEGGDKNKDTTSEVMIDAGEVAGGSDIADVAPSLDTWDVFDVLPDLLPDLPPDLLLDTPDLSPDLPPDLSADLPPDETEVPDTDVGKACATDADCVTNAGCVLGFCTALCRLNGVAIPGACDHTATDSAWGDSFGCPADIDVCLPGAVDDVTVTCVTDGDCAGQGLAATVCAGALPVDGGMAGVCLPIFDRKIAGKSCMGSDGGGQCASLFCLPVAGAGPTGPGMCSAWCLSGDECPGNSICTLWGIEDPIMPDQLLGYAGLCVPAAGSAAPCASDLDCVVGKEYCGYIFPPGADTPARACLDSDNPFGGGPGEDCADASDCYGPLCLFHQWSDKVDPYCSTPCADDDECGLGQVCRELHVAPDGQPAPDGTWEARFCVDPENGAPCFTNEDGFCQHPWSDCATVFGLASWLGLCEDGVCPPDCDGKACQEEDGCGGACLDACLAFGAPCLDDGECLSEICSDGVCCDGPCDGVCESCVLVGAVGTCTDVAADTDPADECGKCALCDGAGACAPVTLGDDPWDWCGICAACDGAGACTPEADGTDPAEDCGICQTCDGEAACRPVAADLDPDEECAEEAPETCGLTGVCDGAGACAWWGSEELCAPPVCASGVATEASMCSGTGDCNPGAFLACHPYGCDPGGATCATTCADHGDCADIYWCQDAACVLSPECPLAASIGCGVQLMGSTQGMSAPWSTYESCTDKAFDGPEKTYKLTLPADTRVTLTLGDQTWDAALLILDTWCSPDQACTTMSDQLDPLVNEVVTFDAAAGNDYHVVVDGVTAEVGGQFSLQVGCCVLQCADENACGDDSCSGSCGACGDGEICTAGQCQTCKEDPGGEPNETCLDALPINLGLHEGHLLCPDTDEDWYTVALSEGQLLTVTLTQADEQTGLSLDLVPPSCGDPLATGTGEGTVKTLSWTSLVPGEYRLRVTTEAGWESAYSLAISMQEPDCVDDDDCAPGQLCGFYQCVPEPPPCETLWTLGCYDGINGDTSDKPSTMEEYDRCTATVWEGPDDKYLVTVEQETVVTALLSGHAFHAGLAALEAYCASTWACVGLADGGTPGDSVAVTFKALPDIPYYVVIEGLTEEDSGTYFLTVDCCLPQCEGKQCGDDGCGLSCGVCENPQDLCIDGMCVCIGACAGKECGDDGCGGTCGGCFGPQDLCVDGVCVCQPYCQDKECGGDGCGGACGECAGPQDACVEGLCICQPACQDKECGDDGCDGICGTCIGPQDLCVDGVCICQPACEGMECGDNGCGGDCGVCAGPQDLCVEGACVCQPACQDKECGDDGCEGICGDCEVYESCTEFQCDCKTDSGLEPNDTCTAAVPIEPGTWEGLAVCLGGDEDWYAVQLDPGQTLTISVAFVHADGDLDVYLYKQGNCLGYVASASSSSDDEAFDYTSTTLSTYLIRVTGYNAGVGTLYDMTVTIQ